jgi:YD repeat-containing protein
MTHEIARLTGDSRTPAAVLTLSVDDDGIEYALTYHSAERPTGERQILVRGPRAVDVLTGFLEGAGPVEGAEAERLAAATRAKVNRQDLGSYGLWTVRDAIGRWFDRAGLSHEWIDVQGGSYTRMNRDHVLVKAPQVGTGRAVSFKLTFWTPGGDNDRVTFEEAYRAPEERLGYSFAVSIPYAELPALAGYLAGRFELPERPDDPEELLISCLQRAIGRGELDLAAGQSVARDQVDEWCAAAGIATMYYHPGYDRRETLLRVPLDGDRVLSLSLTIGAASKLIDFQESYGSRDSESDIALYQLEVPWRSAGALLSLLETQVGEQPEQLSIDDRLVRCFEALAARGELTPARPMAVRDRLAGRLTAAGIEFTTWGGAWTETLLSVHREKTDCIFTLTLKLDSTDDGQGIRFAERYDYLPRAADAGREYAYSVSTPSASAEPLAGFFDERLGRPTTGSPTDRLIANFSALIERGDLGDGLPLEENQARVARWFAEAGVPAEPEKWSWFNSD